MIYLYTDSFSLFIIYLFVFLCEISFWWKAPIATFFQGVEGVIKALQISSQVEAIIPSWTVCMFKKMSPFCTVAEAVTLYLETRASLCVYFTCVCVCGAVWPSILMWLLGLILVYFWIFCLHLVEFKKTKQASMCLWCLIKEYWLLAELLWIKVPTQKLIYLM